MHGNRGRHWSQVVAGDEGVRERGGGGDARGGVGLQQPRQQRERRVREPRHRHARRELIRLPGITMVC